MTTKNLFFFILLFITMTSCQKVNQLSDEASITSFTIKNHYPQVIELGQAYISNDSVIIPLMHGRQSFPLKIVADVNLSSSTDDVIGDINLQDTLVFTNSYDVKKVYLIAESGVPHPWYIIIKPMQNAEITNFAVSEISTGRVTEVKIRQDEVHIKTVEIKQWPVEITPNIEITTDPEAHFKNYTKGEKLRFTSYDDTQSIVVVSKDGDEKEWKIRVTPPIDNSNFDSWINISDPKKINIDPIPGVGLGWATANNTYVVGTTPFPNQNGMAVQMKTTIQDVGFIGLGKLVTAGTIYTGRFILNLKLDNPKSMTYFGIPFNTRPAAIELQAQYTPGGQLQQSVKQNGALPYVLTNLPGTDEGHIWIQVLHWQGSGNLEYHKEPLSNLRILGEGEKTFTGTPEDQTWRKVNIEINYNDPTTIPTHIAIVITSSKRGDEFIGSVGSIMNVDNLSLIYK